MSPIVLSSDPDCPVLDNQLTRVRYDPGAGYTGGVGAPGLRVDIWNGSAYVEQGKMYAYRKGDVYGVLNTWISASLVAYTPERATVLLVLANSADAYSRERIFVTMRRGIFGATFEIYPALKAAGGQADAQFFWAPALNSGAPDLNNGVAKIDSQGSGNWTPGAPGTAVYEATAGTGSGSGNSGMFSSGGFTLGNSNFTTSENWVALLRCPTAYAVIAPFQTTFITLEAANSWFEGSGARTNGYSVGDNAYQLNSQNGAGYLQCQLRFAATQAQQIMEAEAMTLGSGSSVTTDSAASGGDAVTATRTTDANAHVTQATWPNAFAGTFRVFARVKVSAGIGSFYCTLTGGTANATATTTSTTYVWLDLGELTTGTASTLEIHSWISTGSGAVSVDRLEAVLTEDQSRAGYIYSGSRDQAQAALQDSRSLGAVVAR